MNGPQMFFSKKIQVFEVDYNEGTLLSSFSPFDQVKKPYFKINN